MEIVADRYGELKLNTRFSKSTCGDLNEPEF
jgi:hypothetical protein